MNLIINFTNSQPSVKMHGGDKSQGMRLSCLPIDIKVPIQIRVDFFTMLKATKKNGRISFFYMKIITGSASESIETLQRNVQIRTAVRSTENSLFT